MITIFTIPKSFKGRHTGLIQSNAIQSWKFLSPDVEIVLCGDDEGVEETAARYGVKFIGNIERNEWGTPILASAFDQVQAMARHDLLCFVNADIIFLKDFVRAIPQVKFNRFLIVGQRWDFDVTESIDFSSTSWEADFRSKANAEGKLHPPYGSDYFVFRRGDVELHTLPPFAVGRPGWDCWLISHARRLGRPVIDASRAIMPIHQNHDYAHVPSAGAQTSDGKDWRGPEINWHRELIGGTDHFFTPLDATHLLTQDGMKAALEYVYLRNRWYRLPALNPAVAPFYAVADRVVPSAVKRAVSKMLKKQLTSERSTRRTGARTAFEQKPPNERIP